MSAAPQDTCPVSGKIRYVTKARAVMVCKSLQRRNRRSKTKPTPCHAYRCDYCHQFHVGHSNALKAHQ